MINVIRPSKPKLSGLLYMAILLLFAISTAHAARPWPAWQQFKQDYMSKDGRVIDSTHPQEITTSEGQSYALFFALVANDRQTFESVLQWTENNLAYGDLTSHLPAWLWGKDKKQWRILDKNSASDADLWIAYSLLEAGRLWQNRRYQTLGTLLLQRIGREEVVDIPELGSMLLPGKTGFVDPQGWRLNPSYMPLQVLARFSKFSGPWQALRENSQRLLIESAPKGLSPDWIRWQKGQGWQPDLKTGSTGSYDAIRVYLWAGMLADSDPDRARLLERLQPMAEVTHMNGQPPEFVDAITGKTTGNGPVGFSAALLPFLAEPEADIQQLRVDKTPTEANVYYNQVLILFGQGWKDQRYQFSVTGELLPDWSHE